ncbi:zf-HC2 domain-containing protein [Nonomuraea sp. NPDC059007]|uniref:zf-HC2 domain-containing protein n=1 Tax=Nonomuraea sp. NPDC059007 TaxID=3346692 RepID=UPI00368CE291
MASRVSSSMGSSSGGGDGGMNQGAAAEPRSARRRLPARERRTDMQCRQAREAFSVLIDNEEPEVGIHELRAHLDACQACGDWLSRAGELSRGLPGLLPPPPDLTDRVMRHLASRPVPPAWPLRLARVLLGALATCQIAIGYAMVIKPDFILDTGPIHDIREIGAFNLALGVGFLTAALRPHTVWGILPLATAGAVILTATALWDLYGAATEPLRESHHVIVIVGWAVLVWLARLMRNPPEADGARPGGLPARPGGGRTATPPGAAA